MKTKDQILKFLAQNKKLLRDKYHIVRIGLFGSYARGEQNPSSDIDILVEFEENTQDLYELKIQLKEFFRVQLGVDADICREKFIKPPDQGLHFKRSSLCLLKIIIAWNQ